MSRECYRCGTEKELEEFPNNSSKPKGKGYQCKDCLNERTAELRKEYKKENKEKDEKELGPQTCSRCGVTGGYDKFYRGNNKKCGLSSYCRRCTKRRHRVRDLKRKTEIIHGYGGKCECCGENNFLYLTLHHIGGGGKEHREEQGHSRGVYRDLIEREFPDDIVRVLCYNCHFVIEKFGYCPHQHGSSE